MNFKRINSSILFLLTVLVLVSCKREFDSPPGKTIPVGDIVTCADVRAMFTGTPVKITEDKTVYGVITSDEREGNFYKEAYMQDKTGALYLRLTASGGLYKGDSIRLNLNGVTLQDYQGMFQVDSVNVDNNIVKLATLVEVEPTVITIDQIGDAWEGYLLKLDSVQFSAADLGQTYADPINLFSENHMLEDCNANQVIVRSSGYSNFAGDTLPSGRGTFIGILGEFSGDYQLYVRAPSELTLSGNRCSGTTPGNKYLSKDFQDQSLTSGGWTTQVITGTYDWTTSDAGSTGNFYARMSNFSSGNTASETWLISPLTNLSGSTNPGLSFRNACNFTGADVQVKITNGYQGGSPAQATWTDLSPTLSTGGWAWTDSGILSLANFKTNNVTIAFVYTGTNSDGKTWEIDDIVIEEQ